MNILLGSVTLWQRELVRFVRQRSRIVGALGSPVVFWLLLGSGVGRSFSLPSLMARSTTWSIFSRGLSF